MSLEWLTTNHAQEIVELYDGDFKDGWSKKMLEDAFLTGRFLSLGYKSQKKLVGIITCSETLFDADIEIVYVKKEFRKQKIASMLINELEKKLLQNNKEKIFLEVRKSNLPAQNLYAKHGYMQISQRSNYYNDGEDAVIMAKELKK